MPRLSPLLVYLAVAGGWIAFCVVHRFHIGSMLLPRVQAVALGLTFVVAVSLVGAWVLLALRLLRRLIARLRGSALPRATLDRRRAYVPLLALLVLAVGLVHHGLHIEPRSLLVREFRLGAPSLDAPRIAVISDLHIDRWRPPFTELAATVNRTRPDLILLLGDTLNRAAALPALHRCLGAMRAPAGKLAVRGNWDVWYWRHLPLLQGTGFRWLDGAASRVIRGTRVQLVGLSYRDGDHGRRGERLLARLAPGGWRLFLYHTPDMALQVPSADLYLAGHTHGGQVALPLFGALVTLSRHGKRFERGENQVGRMTIYTNPGIGVEPMLPLRLGVPPEVTLIRLGRPPGDQG